MLEQHLSHQLWLPQHDSHPEARSTSMCTVYEDIARAHSTDPHLYHTSQVGKEIGLVDGVGEMRTELQRRYGRYVRLESVEPEAHLDYTRLLRWLL